jgi:hypothetical protein
MSKRLNTYLNNLKKHNIPSKIHVNGVNHLNAIMTVDFYQPFMMVGLSDNEFNKILEFVREATQEILGKNIKRNNVIVEWDAREGIVYSRYRQ